MDKGWVRRSRTVPFARASEEPYRRRIRDGVRLLIALLVTIDLARDSGHSSELALSVFRAINGLPGGLRPLSQLLFHVATLWSVAVVAVAALWARRWRLARDLLLAGIIAWLTARGLGLVVENGFRRGLTVTFRTRASTGFPSVPMAVVVAVVSTAAPYLTRSVRWISRGIALLLVPAEMYLGQALPKSLVCAIAVGVLASAIVHLSLGSPAGRPTSEQVKGALRELGVVAADRVRLAARQPAEHTLMLADDGDAQLLVKVLGRDERDAQRLVRLWKFLLYRDSGPAPYFTRLQDVEHQAYVMLLARHVGVRSAPVVVAGRGGPGTVLLAERRLAGASLAELGRDALTEDLLVDTWLQVGQLHQVRITHGRLTTAHVLVEEAGPTLVGFSRSTASSTKEHQAVDTAELLVTTAHLVGAHEAVSAALKGLGEAALVDSLPLLQSGVLSREAKRLVSGADLDDLLAQLREQIAASTSSELPELQQLRRVSGPTAALTLGLVVAFGALLSSIGDPRDLVRLLGHASPGPLVAALALALGSNVGFALALEGSTSRRLPLWTNLKVQTAGIFANVAFPLGSQALQIRFLQKQGVSSAAAVAGGGLVNLAGGTAAQLALFAVAFQASPATVDVGQIPTGALTTTLEVATVVALALSLLVLLTPKLRRLVLPPVTLGAQTLFEVLRSPRQLSLLLGGSALAYLLSSLALGSTLQAFHQSLPVTEVVAVSIGVTLVAALVPLPGGGGAVSAVGLSGALVSLGVPESTAVATALVNQLLTQYATALPGWLALRSLLKHGDL